MKKWSNVRDSWMKMNRKHKEGQKSGSGANKTRKYIYHDQLVFLKKICEHRASDSSLDAEVHDVSLTSTENQLDNSAPLSVTEEQIGQPIKKTISQERLSLIHI